MVSIKHVKLLVPVSLFAMLAGCLSSSGSKPEEANAEPVDIYAQLNSNNIQYASQETGDVKGSPEYIKKNLQEIRAAYFQKKYDESKKLCKRVLSVAPSNAEVYYWLARIAVDENDFQTAHDMSLRGMPLAKDAYMKRELENIKKMSQMGAK